MSAPPSTYFYVTGFPKSGNKWLQQQLMSVPSLGGFHTDPERGLPTLASAILENADLMRSLRDASVTPDAFVRALLCPSTANTINWPPNALPALRSALGELAVPASRLAGKNVPGETFHHVFDVQTAAAHAARWNIDRWQAVGIPGMHTPVTEVRRHLPSFAIINLVRDPRDVVVSYFYHYISTLTMPLARKFVNVEQATGEISHNPKWKRPFARRVMRALREYYDQRLADASESRDRVLRVRYEDLLDSGCDELQRVLRFVNVEATSDPLRAIVDQHRFVVQTGSSEERRDSLVRKGQAGDWRNYFDQQLLRALGDDFPRLLIELGYEPDDSWMRNVPRRAPKAFDFSRFRIQRSTTRQFAHLWDRSPQLRSKYPDPWQVDENDSFYHWLVACDDPQVQRWLDLARRLQDLWQVNVLDTGRTR
jgi:hypothetical protein